MNKQRILVVEDDSIFRNYLYQVLKYEYEVVAVVNPLEALAELARGKFALMLTDLRMPEMDGVETLRQLRRRWPGLPVVLVSGDDLGADWPFYQQAGADAHLLKPLDVDVLSALLQRRLR